MALDRKLAAWLAAGLIDAETATAIAVYEGGEVRSGARAAAVAIGLLALALGLTLLVAANWDAIPRGVKLGVQMAALAVAGFGCWWWPAGSWRREGALFLFGALVLCGLSLQDQVYQIPQPLWSLLGGSLLLAAPAVLLVGATPLTAVGLAALGAAAALAVAGEAGQADARSLVLANLALALPPLLLLAARATAGSSAFTAALRDAGLTLLLLGMSAAHFAWAVRVSPGDAADLLVRLPLGVAAALGAFWAAGSAPPNQRQVLRAAIGVSLGAVVLAAAVPHADALLPHLVGALLFLGAWALVARAAGAHGWRTLFGIAVAAMAARIFLIYFELFGTLAATGTGLVAGGALLVGLVLAWDRLVRRRS